MSIARYFSPKLRKGLLVGEMPDWLYRHPRKSYIISCVLSTPDWVDRKVLNSMRDEARRLTKETGVLHTLDHRVPLNHLYVCGLTVPWNLRIAPWRVNASKGNKWHPDQLELELTFDIIES